MTDILKKYIPENSIVTDPDIKLKYSQDRSTIYEIVPDIVVRPENIEEIKNILLFARKYQYTITCWGQGTSVTGACVASSKKNIILSMEKLNKIIEIDSNNLIAVVEPGVIVGDLKKEVEKYNLFYPPDPASFESSTIGGNIATGAGGPSAVKYGVTRDYVTGLEVILSDGTELKIGGKIVKNSSGYNLKDLFISSEGTLGIITKIYLKLLPKPLNRISIYVTFNDITHLLKGVNKILTSSIFPVTLEYMDDIALKYLNLKFNLPDKTIANSVLIIELEYDNEQHKENLIEKIYNILTEINGFINIYPLESSVREREIWSARRAIGEVFRENFKYIGKADIVVPRANIYPTIKEIKDFARKLNIEISCFGHAGDGNIHVNILSNDKIENRILNNIYEIVKKNQGMPSGEHGIGLSKKDILKQFLDTKQIEIMKQIKKIFDPLGILNKGKIFDIGEDNGY